MTKPKAMVDIIVKDRNELHNIISEQQKEIIGFKRTNEKLVSAINKQQKEIDDIDKKINKFFMTNEDLSPYLKSKLLKELRAKLKRE